MNLQEGSLLFITSTKSFINDSKQRRFRNNYRYKKHGGNFVNKRNISRRFPMKLSLKLHEGTYNDGSLWICI